MALDNVLSAKFSEFGSETSDLTNRAQNVVSLFWILTQISDAFGFS